MGSKQWNRLASYYLDNWVPDLKITESVPKCNTYLIVQDVAMAGVYLRQRFLTFLSCEPFGNEWNYSIGKKNMYFVVYNFFKMNVTFSLKELMNLESRNRHLFMNPGLRKFSIRSLKLQCFKKAERAVPFPLTKMAEPNQNWTGVWLLKSQRKTLCVTQKIIQSSFTSVTLYLEVKWLWLWHEDSCKRK